MGMLNSASPYFLSQNELADKLSRKLNACRAELALPGLRVRLDAEVAVVFSCVKDGEDASPTKIVHTCGRVGDRTASRVGRALDVEMRDPLAPVRHLREVIGVSVISVRGVVFQPKIGIFSENDLPLLGGNDEVVPAAVLESDLDAASARACSLGKLTEEVEREGVVLVERDLARVVEAANEGLCAKLDRRVKLREVNLFSLLVDLAAYVYVVIPASDAGDVDARARDLRLDGVLACYQLFGFRLIVTADLNELEPRVLDEIKTRRRVVVLYSSYSHIVARLPGVFLFNCSTNREICQ